MEITNTVLKVMKRQNNRIKCLKDIAGRYVSIQLNHSLKLNLDDYLMVLINQF